MTNFLGRLFAPRAFRAGSEEEYPHGWEGEAVAQPSAAAQRLARRLRDLRERHWAHVSVTQAMVATALSGEKSVGAATVSTWESLTAPKLPPRARLSAYARFFATPRSLQPVPRLLDPSDFTNEEEASRIELERELFGLHDAARRPDEAEEIAVRRSWQFNDSGPVTIVCPDSPRNLQGVLGNPKDPNYTELLSYADLDALIELFGHLRAENPATGVFFRRASEIKPDDLSGHVVLLGGIAWNDATRRFLQAIPAMPVRQVSVPELETGEIFVVTDPGDDRHFYPVWTPDEPRELMSDVAWLCRIPNPFNSNRTLTICNGIHSRGVLGAVRCLTDAQVRDMNENYLAQRFPRGDRFSLLLRVPVMNGQALSPDLQNAETRLYEWPPAGGPAT